MEASTERAGMKSIDLRKVVSKKNPVLAKAIPVFVLNYLKRIVHLDEINKLLEKSGDLKDAEFISAALDFFDIKYKVYGEENIPVSGRYFFVSNHPLGGLDGLVFIDTLSRHFADIKFPVNDILMNVENLSGIFLPVNKHGGQAREAILKLEETYASESQILYFPFGLCSRKRKGVIRDLVWHKSFISKAIQYKRDIVPAFFEGRNSSFFYNLANIRTFLGIRANIEMLYLPDEMFRQKGKDITLIFGKTIPWQTLDNTKTPSEWAEWVMNKSYELGSSLTGRS
ncbi:MAG: 1-acyl-sn-glycerol-3-phosphate acyltransferase [Bacteroidales bacterium]|jgi:1-acyl-sn-glycerol-3-phosphate acyltransferase